MKTYRAYKNCPICGGGDITEFSEDRICNICKAQFGPDSSTRIKFNWEEYIKKRIIKNPI